MVVLEGRSFFDSEAARREILRAGGRSCRWSDILVAAYFRGDASALHSEVADALAAARYANEEGFEMPEDSGEAGEAFRLEHELITGEEMERWLDHVGVTLEQFDGHFASRLLLSRFSARIAEIRRDYQPSDGEVVESMWAATLLTGRYEALSLPFAWRVAARHAAGREADRRAAARIRQDREGNVPGPLTAPGLLEELAEMEALLAAAEAESVLPERCARELHAQTYQLTRLAFVEAVFPALDQAREAHELVSADRRDFYAVATEAGVETVEKTVFPDEIADATRSLLFSAAPGAVLAPEAVEGGFILRSLKRRVEPDLADPAVAARVRGRLVAAHADSLLSAHVTWSFDPWTVP